MYSNEYLWKLYIKEVIDLNDSVNMQSNINALAHTGQNWVILFNLFEQLKMNPHMS